MDHSEAIKSQAAEKYLLGELPVELRDQFEEHFFSCTECANDVRSGAALIDNARQVLGEEALDRSRPHAAERRGWFSWLQPAWGLAAAAVLLLGVVAYQNLVTIPKMRNGAAQPQMLATFSFVTAGSRGAGPTTVKVAKDRPFGIYVDIPPQGSFAYYSVDVQTESGERPIHVQVSADQAKDTVQILVPSGTLRAGNGTMIVEGHKAQSEPAIEVARYPFTLQFE